MKHIRTRSLPLILLMVLMTGQALADFGYANSHCRRWLAPEMASEEMARRQWMLGYVTAYARFGDEDILNQDPNSIVEALRIHCRAHPEHTLETTIMEVVVKIDSTVK